MDKYDVLGHTITFGTGSMLTPPGEKSKSGMDVNATATWIKLDDYVWGQPPYSFDKKTLLQMFHCCKNDSQLINLLELLTRQEMYRYNTESFMYICPYCGSNKTYKTEAIHCNHCAMNTEI